MVRNVQTAFFPPNKVIVQLDGVARGRPVFEVLHVVTNMQRKTVAMRTHWLRYSRAPPVPQPPGGKETDGEL